MLTESELRSAYDWLAEHPAIREVILTRGDPLMLSPRRLASIVEALSAIPHIEILRIHTRVPVAEPARVTDALTVALDTPKIDVGRAARQSCARVHARSNSAAIRHIQARRGTRTRAVGADLRRKRQRGGAGDAVPCHAPQRA